MTSIRFTISIFYLALLPGFAAAPPLAKRVDEAMRDEMARQELVGLAVGVVQDGKIAHLNGYGLAKRSSNSSKIPRPV